MIITLYIQIAIAVMGLWLILTALKRNRRRHLLAAMRRFNASQDLEALIYWIREKDMQGRLTDVLDYLQKIQEDELGLKVVDRFDPGELTKRHVQVFACRAYKYADKKAKALQMADTLMKRYPGDDSILDIYIDIQLFFEQWGDAERALMPRLERKTHGTVFKRHHARLLAGKGDKATAVKMLQEVVNQDFALYKNTFAPGQKRLVYEQYVESQTILDNITGKQTDLDEESG